MNPSSAFTGWRTSTRSASQGQCVEVAVMPTAVGVRDTKNRDGGTLAFSSNQWAHFSDALKDGAYDA